jgi:Na+-driven multidrug efflux pump
LGILYIASTFAGIFSIIKESVLAAFQPYYFNLDKHDKIDDRVYPLINDIMIIVGIGALLIAFFNEEVIYVFSNNKELIDACKYVPLLVGGYYLVFVGQMLNVPIYLSKKYVKYMIFITITCLIINVSGNWWLIPKLGILGLAIVKIAAYGSQVVSSSILNYLNGKKYRFPYLKMYSILIVVAFLISLYYLPIHEMMYRIIFKSTVIIIIIFAFVKYANRKYKLQQLLIQQLQKFNIIK